MISIQLSVSQYLRQKSNTEAMIRPIPYVIALMNRILQSIRIVLQTLLNPDQTVRLKRRN